MIVSLLRKEARENLKGKWKKGFIIMFLFYIINILTGTITTWIATTTPYGLIALVLNIAITIPLNYGLLVSFIKLKRNEEVNYFHFVYYAIIDLEKVWKVLGKLILKLLPYIMALTLFAYLMITEFVSLYYGNGMRLSYIVEILGVILFSVLLSMKALYYSLNNYILYDNTTDKAKEILKESQRLMTNHRWDFLRMNLSFTGWFILGLIFSVGIILLLLFVAKIESTFLFYITYIPQVFLMPYMYITTVYFYDNLVYNNPKQKQDATNKKKKAGKKK